MRNPLISLNVRQPETTFPYIPHVCVRACVCAYKAAYTEALSQVVSNLFGSSPWGHGLRGALNRRGFRFSNFWNPWESGCDIAF